VIEAVRIGELQTLMLLERRYLPPRSTRQKLKVANTDGGEAGANTRPEVSMPAVRR
jgi:hypothetical protein